MKNTARLTIRPVRPEDSAALASIYNHYIAHSIATFEEDALSTEDMGARMDALLNAGFPWWVAEGDEGIVGYAYAGPWNSRSAYRYSVETTVYVAVGSESDGVGSQLYETLFAQLANGDYRVAIAGISLPNEASVALHEKFGMQKVAQFSDVGYKFDRWIDVGYWQRSFSKEGN